MKIIATLFVFIEALLVLPGYAQTPPQVHYIGIPQADLNRTEYTTSLQRLGLSDKEFHLVYAGKPASLRFVRLSLPETSANETLEQLIKSDLFATVESDAWGQLASCTLATDPGFSLLWGLENDGSLNGAIAGADISACEAWDLATGDSSVIVGFIDSGCRLDHSDLTGRIWENTGEIPNNGIDDDNNGYIDDQHGWNTAFNTSDLTDNIGHGTQITGIVGANPNNNTGFTGLDWNCQLMNVKGVNDNGSGLLSWWAEGVYYLTDNGADVINMSLTGYNQVQALEDAINYAEQQGVLVVAAVGNNNQNVIGYPAKYPSVLAVGATNYADQRAVWSGGSQGSNYGPEVDVVAPGLAIYGLNHLNNSLSYVSAGTSQASPLAAATASLMLSLDPTLTPDSLRNLIRQSSEDEVGLSFEDVPGFDEHHGYGRLNAFAALQAATPPSVSVEEASSSNAIQVFPNPFQSEFTVGQTVDIYRLEVRSITGQVVHQQFISAEQSVVRTPFPAGSYLLYFYSTGGLQEVKKVIKTSGL